MSQRQKRKFAIQQEQEPVGPTSERLKMAGEEVDVYTSEDDRGVEAIRLLDNHVLEFLRMRGVLTSDQFAAGFQFYRDWYISGLANNGVVNPARIVVDGGKGEHLTDIKLAAMNRWQKAVKALGLIQSQVLTDIVLGEERLEQYGLRRFGQKNPKLARLAAQTALKLALEQLDLFYYGPKKAKMRTSHVPDYRPTIISDEQDAAVG